MIPHVISQQKTVTTSTVKGSSSSTSSTVTRTCITSSTTFHSESSSSRFETSEKPENVTVRETIKRLDQLSIKEPSKRIISRKDDNALLAKSKSGTPSALTQLPVDSTVNSIEKFQLDCLEAHNDYRRKHGVGPLKLSPALSNFAQNWANVSLSSIYSFTQNFTHLSFADHCK